MGKSQFFPTGVEIIKQNVAFSFPGCDPEAYLHCSFELEVDSLHPPGSLWV